MGGKAHEWVREILLALVVFIATIGVQTLQNTNKLIEDMRAQLTILIRDSYGLDIRVKGLESQRRK